MCRICPYSARTDASIDPKCRQFRRVVRRMKLNAIPLPGSWLPELLGASAADLCLSRMASPLAGRPFSVASLDCARFCCGRAGVAPRAEALGQPVMVENKGGASGLIGVEAMSHAAADGYTLALCGAGTITAGPHLRAKLPFDPMALAHITRLVRMPFIVAVRNDL